MTDRFGDHFGDEFGELPQKRKPVPVGQRFGRLIVVGGTRKRVLAECDCGRPKTTCMYDLSHGRVSSCGCLRRELTEKKNRTHGKKDMPEYRVWRGMIARCEHQWGAGYENYGGRGIRVCEQWRHDFNRFLVDMGERPSPELSIDRIDNNKGYSPDNCRWATVAEQSNNKRSNLVVEINGRRQTTSEWAREIGIKPSLVFSRIHQGWDPVQALTEPVVSKPTDLLLFDGESKTVAQWARQHGIPRDTLSRRLKMGWDTHTALTKPVRFMNAHGMGRADGRGRR